MDISEDFIKKLIFPVQKIIIETFNPIMKIYKSGKFEKINKEDGSPVTKADKLSNSIIFENLQKISPEIEIISEETFDNKILNKLPITYWLIDPLDGTKEFINKSDDFTVNIALIHNKKVVFGAVGAPASGRIWNGSIIGKNQNTDDNMDSKLRIVMSKSHKNPTDIRFLEYLNENGVNFSIVEKGSSLKLCALSDNDADIYPRFGPTSEWDIAAAHAVLNANGGNVLRFSDFSELSYTKRDSILNPPFIGIRNDSIKEKYFKLLGDFNKKLV